VAPRFSPPTRAAGQTHPVGSPLRIELHDEEVVARRTRELLGEVRVRTVVDEVPRRVTAEVTRDEVTVERVPVNQEVNQRYGPWEEDGAQVIPIYEERLVLVKQLVLKEKVVIRRVEVAENRPMETKVRRERIVVDAPPGVVVREQGEGPPSGPRSSFGDALAEEVPDGDAHDRRDRVDDDEDRPGPLERVVRKLLS
jgi:uncharacterized protein (TIGR02271 family)